VNEVSDHYLDSASEANSSLNTVGLVSAHYQNSYRVDVWVR
jgi:hypothetical protein